MHSHRLWSAISGSCALGWWCSAAAAREAARRSQPGVKQAADDLGIHRRSRSGNATGHRAVSICLQAAGKASCSSQAATRAAMCTNDVMQVVNVSEILLVCVGSCGRKGHKLEDGSRATRFSRRASAPTSPIWIHSDGRQLGEMIKSVSRVTRRVGQKASDRGLAAAMARGMAVRAISWP